MSEQERENVYWYISLFFLALSPVIVYSLFHTNITPAFSLPFFVIFLVVSIPLTIIIEMVLTIIKGEGDPLRFWLVNPSVTCRHRIEGECETRLQAIQERLINLGFSKDVLAEAGGIKTILFRKEPRPLGNAFLDHKIWGQVRLQLDTSGVELQTEVTFGDTLIVETGELAQTQALCEYISLQIPEFTYKNVPLTLYCGLNLAFIAAGLSILRYVYPRIQSSWLLSVAAGAGGMILMIVVLMLKDLKHLFGYRLVFAGLYLALLPYVCLALKIL